MDKAILRFFLRGSLTKALFRWLAFEQAARQGRRLNADKASSAPTDALGWLKRWEHQADLDITILGARSIAFFVLSGLGVGTMLGVLAVSLGQAVNIWGPLLAFAILPFVFFLFSLVMLLKPGRSNLMYHPMLRSLAKAMRLHTYQASSTLLFPWLQWQWQRAGSLFLVTAILTFFVYATFQDVHFVWSSTFIDDDAVMHRLFSLLAWPWHWWVAAPSLESVVENRLHTGVTLPARGNAEPLWPFVIYCISVYGLLPRLLLVWIYRWRLKAKLKRTILDSASVDVFLNVQQHDISRAALNVVPDNDLPVEISIQPENQELIGWCLQDSRWALLHNLGMGRWQDDTQWLETFQVHASKEVLVLVDFWQTPVGELADCLNALRPRCTDLNLVLINTDQSSTRSDAQWRSWSFFAERCHVALRLEASE